MKRQPVLPPIQRSCLWLAAGLAVFAVYGSLIPFGFVARPVGDAAAAFVSGMSWPGRSPASDVISNVLLFWVLGFFGAGASCPDNAGRRCRTKMAAVVVLGLAAMAVLLEFAQTFFPARTVSLDDILALTAGAAIGASGWLIGGPVTMSWLWRHLRRRAPASAAVKILTMYVAFFALAQLAPLDITIEPGQLREKFAEGRMVLWPLARLGPMPALRLLESALFAVPLGLLGVLGWPRLDRERHPAAAVVAGLGLVWGIAAVQVFIYSHATNLNDPLAGSVGVIVAVTALMVARTKLSVPARGVAP